ncbi:MAG: hypothetical protein J6S73_06245 [Lentisphaeria bacterium]|nr:hypothetical protein [Lentisphaeria bacterium]
MKNLFLAMLLCGTLTLAAETVIPIKKNMVFSGKTVKIESLMDEDGAMSVQFSKQLQSPQKGNEYIDAKIKLPETVDLTGKAIVVTVLSEKPENIGGFYVRAYNADNIRKAASSHVIWSNTPFLKEQYADITVIPGKGGLLQWEPVAITGEAPTNINLLSIHAGSPKRNTEMSFRIKSVKIVDSPLAAMDKFFADFGEFSGFAQSGFSSNTQAKVEGDVLKVYGTAVPVAGKPKATMYQGLRIVLAKPVDVTGKKLSFEYRTIGPVGAVYFRGKELSPKKTCFSFSSGQKAKDWKAVTLPLEGPAPAGFKHETAYSGDLTKFQSLSVIFPIAKAGAEGTLEIRNIKLVD